MVTSQRAVILLKTRLSHFQGVMIKCPAVPFTHSAAVHPVAEPHSRPDHAAAQEEAAFAVWAQVSKQVERLFDFSLACGAHFSSEKKKTLPTYPSPTD